MKYEKNTITLIVLLPILCWSCKTQDVAKKTSDLAELAIKIDSLNYTFTPTTANPLTGGAVPLSGEYMLRVANDSITSFLPYFGRSYVAPMNPSEGGIKFICTKFDYEVKKGKTGWKIKMKTADIQQIYELRLDITCSGYGTLTVNEPNRQAISFYGTIE